MVKVFVGTAHEFYMDGILQQNLDTAKKVITEDWDMVFVYDGPEGSGKSVKCMQDAYYCDPSPSLLDRYCFSAYQFRKVVHEATKYQAVVYDEAHAGLNARAAMSYINRALVSMLTEIRQKNLFVFIVLPTFFDLDRYVALWRSRALVHVYTKNNFERGYFAFYNSQRKKDLYMQGKKLYSYRQPKPNFIGRFLNTYPLDEKKYRQLKRDSLMKSEKSSEDAEMIKRMQEMLWDRLMEIGDDITNKTKAKLLHISEMTFYRWMNEWKMKGEMNGETSLSDNTNSSLIDSDSIGK
jgi:hypothetical protein